jgi:dihydropteroate synthase
LEALLNNLNAVKSRLDQIFDLKSPQIMGVLNITPDSFSDGGSFTQIESAVQHALKMAEQGATIIDIGGESTRPNALPVSTHEEILRVVPVIEGIRLKSDIAISIDTSKADVMKAAIEAGADFINDVYALQRPGSLDMAASLGVPVCLMHMQADPTTMQDQPYYLNVVEELNDFFAQRIAACEQVGIAKGKIILDPGFGFGKTLQHNLTLLAKLKEFESHGCPILAGLSRKSMFGQLLDKKVDERLIGSVSAALLAVANGASIVRVHDVAETADALKVYMAVQAAK